MYCKYCGNEVEENQQVCLKCGCLVENGLTNAFHNEINSEEYYKKLSEYEKMSGIVWLIIGIVQICTLVGVICGIWNIIASTSRLKYSKELLTKPNGIVERFENQLTEIVIIMVLNIFFGAIIGVIGSVIDLFVRNYVIENKKVFN